MMKALITGASEGIGRSLAKKLARAGFEVTVTARNADRLAELVMEMGGPPHTMVVNDLTAPTGLQELTRLVCNGHFNVLINNAGFGLYGLYQDQSLVRIQEMLRVNCEAVYTLTHAFLRTATAGDAVVNVSSIASFLPMPYNSAYTATKAFVTSLSECLWYEQKARGIYVMALCPGTTLTEFHSRAGGSEKNWPDWTSQTADQVAEVGLRELRRRKKPVVMSGPQAPLARFARIVPRRWVVDLAGRMLQSRLPHSD